MKTRMEMLDLAEGLAAVVALRKDQARAVETGLDQLTLEEIDAEIRAARESAATLEPSDSSGHVTD